MSSSNDESMRHPWDAVIRELVAKGEVPEEVLSDSDAIIRWWRSLERTKQDEITSRVRDLSQGQGVGATVTEKQRYQKESKVTKWYRKPRYIVLGVAIVLFCFVPVMDMEYLVVVEKQVLEPYTVQVEVKEPYISYETRSRLQDTEEAIMWEKGFGPMPSVPSYYTVTETVPITRYRTVTKEVTRTRLVTRPVAETRTKRVSILRYLLR